MHIGVNIDIPVIICNFRATHRPRNWLISSGRAAIGFESAVRRRPSFVSLVK